jgi:hypothetical protein
MPKDKGDEIFGGQFYERTPDGRMKVTAPEGRAPDAWICRRVSDYAPSPIPENAGIGACQKCRSAIVFNPKRLDTVPADTPMICMQCTSIKPLPIES